MKTTIPKLRKMIRKVIVESMSPSDPDYEMVAEAIMQVKRKIMFGQIRDEVALREQCELIAGDYEVYHHVDYMYDICLDAMRQMGM